MSVLVKLMFFVLKCQVLEQVLSWQFCQVLVDGELEFFEGCWLSIYVCDIDLKWYIMVENEKLIVSQQVDVDVSFSVDVSDLLMIVVCKQDLDMFFFQC